MHCFCSRYVCIILLVQSWNMLLWIAFTFLLGSTGCVKLSGNLCGKSDPIWLSSISFSARHLSRGLHPWQQGAECPGCCVWHCQSSTYSSPTCKCIFRSSFCFYLFLVVFLAWTDCFTSVFGVLLHAFMTYGYVFWDLLLKCITKNEMHMIYLMFESLKCI